MIELDRYFKILRHVDPTMQRSQKFKKMYENSMDEDKPEVLLLFSIEMIKVLDEKIKELMIHTDFD